MTERLYVGFWSVALVSIGLMLTMGLLWLSVQGAESIWNGFVFLYLPGLCMMAVTWKEGITARRANPNGLWMMVAIGLVLQFMIQLAVMLLFPSSLEGGGFSNVLIAVLFAIYEETAFLGLAGLMKMVNLPDIVVIGISMLVFPLLHALAYPSTMAFNLGLAAGRGIFTGMVCTTDNTDAGFLIHVLWNLGVTV